MIAFLLNPLVRDLQRMRLPRGVAVALVFLLFAAAVTFVALALGSVVVDQTRSATARIDDYVTVAERARQDRRGAGHRPAAALARHARPRADPDREAGDGLGRQPRRGRDLEIHAGRALVRPGAATSIIVGLFNIVLIVVISIYMLLDMERLERLVDRRFPPGPGCPLTQRIEKALAGYVRGQLILSTVIGLGAGIGMWILGRTGLVPGADKYALLFGVWTAVIEVIPYIGPWLSAVPPAIYALVVDPVSVLWVIGALRLHLPDRGPIVVPNVMASALRLHPLLVIFGLLAGGELYGIAGVFCWRCRRWPRHGRSGVLLASGSSSSRGTAGTRTPSRSSLEGAT